MGRYVATGEQTLEGPLFLESCRKSGPRKVKQIIEVCHINTPIFIFEDYEKMEKGML